jgi:hypothetical protein
MFSIVYQNRALRAVHNCNAMPTTWELMGLPRPGFMVVGELFGRIRSFSVVDDQLFLVTDRGPYLIGQVQPQSLEKLEEVKQAWKM